MFVLPTQAECQGVVFNEAAAHGLPVIATDTGGVSSVVQHGKTGSLMSAHSLPTEWAEEILALTGDRARYESYSLESARTFPARLSWKAAVGRVMSELPVRKG